MLLQDGGSRRKSSEFIRDMNSKDIMNNRDFIRGINKRYWGY